MSTQASDNNKVYACAIQNDSEGDIHAVVIYAGIPDVHGEIKQTRVEQDVAKGQRRYLYQRLVTRPTHNIIEVIERLEVTKANGSKLELKAPFAGVKGRITDWVFVVTDKEIKSGEKKQ
ncbi:unnamed protein product [Adineta ricciae]|uniref:Uncharacterized protein n=1 Tax=Adineta ricciae TaxID=249248 RepID=A0A815LN75_ADIRI|nr:unnamed protein product [Adineta ricciae]CAF1664926.1 unnamed protein product [Adineta ricciae]